MDTDKKSINNMPLNPSNEKKTYTVPEICEMLQIGKSKAYELCNQNLFKTIKIGRSVRILKISFDEWLDNQIN